MDRDHHCGLIGYLPKKKAHVPIPPDVQPNSKGRHGVYQPVKLSRSFYAAGSTLPVPPAAGGSSLPPADASSNSSVGKQGRMKNEVLKSSGL